jgi:hypothetical protein
MTSLREASPENAAASQVLAGARAKGVRRGFPIPSSITPESIKRDSIKHDSIKHDPQRPVPLQAGAFSFPPPACAAAPLLSIPRVVIIPCRHPRTGHSGRPITVP